MKILILKNKQDWKSWNIKVQSIKDWFSPAVTLEIDTKKVNYSKFQWIDVKSSDNRDIKVIDRDFMYNFHVENPGYDCIILSTGKGWKANPVEGYHEQIKGKHVIAFNAISENGSYNFMGTQYEGGKWFNIMRHELCHFLYQVQEKVDRTHFHWDSGDLSKVLLELKNGTSTVTITRNQDDGVQTLGTLEYDGFKCNTLERSWKNNAINISCIPKGEYKVKWTFSPKFMRYTYEVQNVPKRSGIRFHLGNFFTDISGCILLGNGYKDLNIDGRLDITNSTIITKTFETLLNKQEFKLIIK